LKEIKSLQILNHTNIIKLHNAFHSDPDTIVLIMEYASGGELREYVSSKGSLNEDESKIIFKQIISAVKHCHKNSIIHRDLKLENILFANPHSHEIKVFITIAN